MCVCVVSVIVKRPVFPPCVVDGRSRNPLYYYYHYYYYLRVSAPCQATVCPVVGPVLEMTVGRQALSLAAPLCQTLCQLGDRLFCGFTLYHGGPVHSFIHGRASDSCY